MHSLQEHFGDVCSQVIPWLEFLNRKRPYTNHSTIKLANRYEMLHLEANEDENDDDAAAATAGLTTGNGGNALIQKREETPHTDDVRDHRGYNTVVRKFTKTKANLHSKPCHFKFWCANGLKCDYKHGEEEREFFKLYPEVKNRKNYKLKACPNQEVCEYKDKSFLCRYAHGVLEARCLCCGQRNKEPHWMDQCPFSKIKK